MAQVFDVRPFVSDFCSQAQVLEIKKAFDLFDSDLGGSIDPKELKDAIESLGIQTKANSVYQILKEIDKDGTGMIEFDEFFKLMTTRPSENQSEAELRKIFATFDPENKGHVDVKDLRRVARELGELTDDQLLQEMIERADLDQDGVVNFLEFYNLMTKKAV